MKNALPENAKISKEAKECMQECVSEFISFVTSEATERCSAERRKTVNGEDILFALTSLGFENYSEVLKIYLAKYRQVGSMSVLFGKCLMFRRVRMERPRKDGARKQRATATERWMRRTMRATIESNATYEYHCFTIFNAFISIAIFSYCYLLFLLPFVNHELQQTVHDLGCSQHRNLPG